MNNSFCHVELLTKDPEKAKAFYGKLFSWKFEDMSSQGGMPYTMIQTGAEPGGGIMKAPEQAPVGWGVYVLVDNVAQYAKKTVELGGGVLVPEQEVPGYGKFVVIQDPTGGVISLWQPLQK